MYLTIGRYMIVKPYLHYRRHDVAALHDSFTLHHTYPYSRERLFAALSDPALKRRWHANPKTETELFESDFRIGGADRQRYVLGPDSPFPGCVMENEGRFEDIVEGERIVLSSSMTFGGRRISTSLLTFELRDEHGVRRRVHEASERDSASSKASHPARRISGPSAPS